LRGCSTPPLNNDQQHCEWQTILHIAKNNKFPTTLLHKLKHQIQHRITCATPPTSTENSPKWATFNFTSPHIHRITNLFKHTNVRIAFRSNNTIAQITKPPNDHNIPSHNKWGIYQLTCNSCNLSCEPNQPQPEGMLSGTYQIQQSTVSIRTAHPMQPA